MDYVKLVKVVRKKTSTVVTEHEFLKKLREKKGIVGKTLAEQRKLGRKGKEKVAVAAPPAVSLLDDDDWETAFGDGNDAPADDEEDLDDGGGKFPAEDAVDAAAEV